MESSRRAPQNPRLAFGSTLPANNKPKAARVLVFGSRTPEKLQSRIL